MNDDLTTSPTLIQRIRANDQTAWAQFNATYRNYLYCVARSMGMNNEDAGEIAQDVMVRVWKSIDRYEYGRNNARFRTWLHTITRNCVLSFVDKQRRRLQPESTDATVGYLNAIAIDNLDEIAEKEWKIFLTNLALERIEPNFRGHAIPAFKAGMNGESTSAIAERLDLAPDTVTRLKHRVRHRLVKEIALLRSELE